MSRQSIVGLAPTFSNYCPPGNCFRFYNALYLCKGKLGEGDFSTAYRFDTTTPNCLAPASIVLKIAHADDERPNFVTEANWNKIFYGFGYTPHFQPATAKPIMIMRFFEGTVLSAVQPSSMTELVKVFIALLVEFNRIHNQLRAVHGDVKPPNVIYNPETGICQTIDLALPAEIGKVIYPYSFPLIEQQNTKTRSIEAEYGHIAPELTKGENTPAHPNQDMYGIGYIFNFMLRELRGRITIPDCQCNIILRMIQSMRSRIPEARMSVVVARDELHVGFFSPILMSPRFPDSQTDDAARREAARIAV